VHSASSASAHSISPNGVAAWLALLATRLSGLVRVALPQPERPAHRAWRGARTARGHHAMATRAAARWCSRHWRRRASNAVWSLGRASR
jgi:hypothetical protein